MGRVCTFPRANRAPSKNSKTPRNMKSPPKVVRATPISSRHVNGWQLKINGERTLRVRQPHPARWGISGHVSTERVYSSCAVGGHATVILNSHEYVGLCTLLNTHVNQEEENVCKWSRGKGRAGSLTLTEKQRLWLA